MDEDGNGKVNSGEFASFIRRGKRSKENAMKRKNVDIKHHYQPPPPPCLESEEMIEQSEVKKWLDKYAVMMYKAMRRKVASEEAQEAEVQSQVYRQKRDVEKDIAHKSQAFAIEASETGNGVCMYLFLVYLFV